MNSLQIYLNRIRRHPWLVLFTTVAATLGALLYTVGQPTIYTARSTLTTASENRSPDQDAYLAEGFAQYFNKESYQERIRALAQVPKDFEVSALTGATSPILYIEVTGPDSAVATSVAARVAERFPDDVQAIPNSARDEEIATIDRRIKDKQALLNQLKRDSDQRALILSEISDLQRQANDLRDNTTNRLVDLQRDAGVSAHQPSLILNGLLGFAGGLALGCAAALALAVLRNRIATPDDVRRLLGLPTLAVLDGGRRHDDRVRAERLESLAAVVSLSDLPRPATLAITTPRRTSLTSHVAEGIVYYEALQGTRTLLVRADLRGVGTDVATDEATVASLLAGISTAPPKPMEIAIGAAEILVLPSGMPLTADPFALFAPAQFDALLRQLSGLADLIVVEAPPVNEAAESQIICAAADQTVLVVEERVTRGSEAIRACELLTQVGASMLGAVLGRPVQKPGNAEPFSTLPVVDMVRHPLPTPSPDLTGSVPESLVKRGESEEDTLPETRGDSPQVWTDRIDSAPPVVLAESAVGEAPVSASAALDAIASPIRSEVGPVDSAMIVHAQRTRKVNGGHIWPLAPWSGAQDHSGGEDDEGSDTEPMTALKDTGEQASAVEETFDQPTAARMAYAYPAVQPQSVAAYARGASPAQCRKHAVLSQLASLSVLAVDASLPRAGPRPVRRKPTPARCPAGP
jgi:capsular polysaccharide biosynthesis protein/MinD-like ATPase involved in chromosome partitioning or flagellar assembly